MFHNKSSYFLIRISGDGEVGEDEMERWGVTELNMNSTDTPFDMKFEGKCIRLHPATQPTDEKPATKSKKTEEYEEPEDDYTEILYPTDGETCYCGGTIRFLGMKGYENGYYCDECDREWWYD